MSRVEVEKTGNRLRPTGAAQCLALLTVLGCESPGARNDNEVSPARDINQPDDRGPRPDSQSREPFRSINGADNNRARPQLGAAATPLRRLATADYADGSAAPAGATRPSARAISNAVAAQVDARPNSHGASDFLWQWGQFIDHDIDLTDGTDPPEPLPIEVPLGDPSFDPEGTGVEQIAFNRSIYAVGTPRQQLNEITHWLDASNVYGSDEERALALRTNDGSGRLLVSSGDLLPFNTSGLANAGGDSASLFLAGDVRANEQVGLTVMHTLFVREHNRVAVILRATDPELSGDEIYELARQRVGALMQVITYNEYLPALLGQRLAPYRGYDPNVDARISNLFSSAIYRYGHSALSTNLLRIDSAGNPIDAGHLPLREAFFSPSRVTDEGGIEPLLRGLAAQRCQSVDVEVIDDVRNFLFGPPGAGGFDLVSLNIQRGRDHGVPSYNTTRLALGLAEKPSLAAVSSDSATREKLAAAYQRVDDVDLWVGALAEDPLANSHVGELMSAVISDQFEALRDGDRFWYANVLPPQQIREVERTTLADVIRRNTTIGNEIGDDVFHVR